MNFWASDQSAWYLKAAYETTLPWYEIGFSAHVGYSTGDAFDVDLADVASFLRCVAPGEPVPCNCRSGDTDGAAGIDLDDLAQLIMWMEGPATRR